MSFSTDWLGLNNHEILREIQKRLPSKHTKAKNLMDCNDTVLFLWDPVDECLLTLHLRPPDSGRQPHQVSRPRPPGRRWASLGVALLGACQTLVPQTPPNFGVERVLCCDTGRQVALAGPQGVAVLDVPRRWNTAGKFQAGSKAVRCRTVLSPSSLEVRQVRWHPGSPTDSHLLVLTSDNSLRLYCTSTEPEVTLLNTWPLGRGPLGGVTSSAKLPLLGGLGETAVDFDFAAPPTPRKTASKAGDAGAKEAGVEWPIMVLRGNGDVYCVTAPLTRRGGASSKAVVRGPLTMYPPADDNYGADACSVLVLHTSPPVLVVGTSAGTLYHCMLLSPEDEDQVEDGATLRDLSLADGDVSRAWNAGSSSHLAGQPVLHVFESVELELGLSLDDNLLEDASFNCPLHLQRHPTANDRYLVSHEAGIHILFLPIVTQLNKFVEASEDFEDTCLPKFDSYSNAVAEYLLCTRVCGPTSGNESTEITVSSPILGLALSSSPATLIALLAGGEIVSLLLSSLHLPSAFSESLLTAGGEIKTPKLNEEPFDEHIRKLLKHRGTLPILKFEEKMMSNPQEAFKLITRVTQLLYENYFQRHEQAHEDIENRQKRLQRIKELQLADLRSLALERDELKSKLEVLIEKYKDIRSKQDDLSARAESVLRNVSWKQPDISNAEIQMKKDLTAKQNKLAEMKKKLENIKKYSLDQKSQLDHWNQKKKVVSISESKRELLKNNLKQMGEELKTLTSVVRTCQAELGI